MESLRKKVLATEGMQPSVSTVLFNMQTKGYLVDSAGNRLRWNSNGRNTNVVPCVDPGDPDDVGYTVTLQSITSTYTCSSGTSYKETWIIRSPYNLVQQSPFNPNNQSYGRLRIRNSSNTVVFTSPNYSPVTISSPITDPTNPDRYQYTVTFTTGSLSQSTINSGNSYEHRLQVYTDCSQQSVAIGVQLSTTSNIGETTPPCQKLDKIALNGPPQPGYFPYARIYGCNAVACSGYSNNPDALPNGHEVQWRNVGDNDADWRYTNWQNSYTSSQYIGDPVTGTAGSIANADVQYISPNRLFAEKVSGGPYTSSTQLTAFPAATIEMRYRNVMWDITNYPAAQRHFRCAGFWSEPVPVAVQ